jgi:dTMP kinase
MLRGILLSGEARHLGATGEALLFSAARIDHIDQVIRPALARGDWVICDRFSDSTRAYQGALGQSDPNFLAALERVTLDGLKPDLTLILDLPSEIGLARAAARRGTEATDRFETEDAAFHESLRNAFRAIAANEPERCALIDASRDEAHVAKAIWGEIEQRLLKAHQP